MKKPPIDIPIKYKLMFVLAAFIVGVVWLFLHTDKDAQAERKYFGTLNFSMKGIVKQITVTGDGGYGVIYLKVIENNKGYHYESKFKGQYLYCKIHDDEAIMMIPGSEGALPGDSVVVNTNQSKYLVYRNGASVSYLGPWLNDRDAFYDYLTEMGYLDFNYYHKNKVLIRKLSIFLF